MQLTYKILLITGEPIPIKSNIKEKFGELKNLNFGQNEKSLNNSDIKSKEQKKMGKIQKMKSKVKNTN